MDKILDTFLLTYRTTPNSTLPKQQSPAEMFLGRKPRTTLDLLLPTKQPSGHDVEMEPWSSRTEVRGGRSSSCTISPFTGLESCNGHQANWWSPLRHHPDRRIEMEVPCQTNEIETHTPDSKLFGRLLRWLQPTCSTHPGGQGGNWTGGGADSKYHAREQQQGTPKVGQQQGGTIK